MKKSLLEQLPQIVAEGKRRAEQIFAVNGNIGVLRVRPSVFVFHARRR